MQVTDTPDFQVIAHWVGWSLLATIVIGMAAAFTVAAGIDINLSADVTATARNMLDAELQLRAKAYIAALLFALNAVVSVGLYLLLRRSGQLLAGACLFVTLGAAGLALLGAVFALNAAEIASNPAFSGADAGAQRLLLASLQATSDYTSFHLGLVLSTAAQGGFYLLFLRSGLIPKLIAGWGLFASAFVVVAIVARDFIPALGNHAVTAAFMLCNLVALVAAGLYPGLLGVRTADWHRALSWPPRRTHWGLTPGRQDSGFPLADCSGTTCSASRCIALLRLSAQRKMSMPASS